MSSGNPSSRDWRAQPPAQSLYAREWRGGGGTPPSRFSKSFKLRALVLTLTALLGVIVFLLAMVGKGVPATQIVSFGIGAYGGRANPQGNMPINPFGEQDARAFQVLADLNPTQFPAVRQEDNALSGAQFLTFLQQEADAPSLTGRNLVVFGTLHALVQPSGTVELFAIDATPDSPGSSSGAMVPFEELLSRLQASPARRVLLALDTSRLESDWRLGILANDVADQIVFAEDAGPKSPSGRRKVAILLAATSGERSRSTENGSAFVRFLVEGLSGAADGWSNGKRDGSGPTDRRVTLHELKEFVETQVEEWSLKQAGTRQHVRLCGDTSDWEVAVVSPPPAPEPPAGTKATAKETAESDEPKGNKAAPGDKGATTAPNAVGASESKPTESQPAAAPAAPAKPPVPEVKWDVRLAELQKARDAGWSGEGDRGIPETPSRMPLAWRTFETQLARAGALERGGLAELAPRAVQQADATYKRIQARLASPVGLEAGSDTHRQALQQLGFGPAVPPAKDAIAVAEKFLQSLAADPPNTSPSGPAAPPPATAAPPMPEPDPAVLVLLLQRQLLEDPTPASWARIKQAVDRLAETGRWPTTPASQLIRDVLGAEGGAALGKGAPLARLFALQERYRQLASRHPESLPMVRDRIAAGLRALTAAQQWLVATGPGRPELREWLERAELNAAEAEGLITQYADAIETWSALLVELPSFASLVAARADDDDRQVDWSRLRELARLWGDSERDGRWDASSLRELWPEKPARLTDLERLLLVQFADAQRLKKFFAGGSGDGEGKGSADELSRLARDAAAHRRDFQDELARSMPRLGTASAPTPAVWREAERLLGQPWISSDIRRQMDSIVKLTPRGDTLPARSTETGALWQGFWAIATLSLLGNDDEGTTALWKEWERLVELSRPAGGSEADPESRQRSSTIEHEALRKRRAELGRSIRQRWSVLQARAQSPAAMSSLPACHLAAATLDPTLLPASDPDQRIRSELQAQFAGWLALFAADWRGRSLATTGGSQSGYSALAARAEGLAQELGVSAATARPQLTPRWEEVPRPAFTPQREGRLELAVASGDAPRPGLQVNLSGPGVRLVEQATRTSLERGVVRPLAAGGKSPFALKLDDSVETPQTLLAVLTEADGFPLDFRQILLYPPFDPSQWRIEFTDAESGAPLESVPLSRTRGTKIFLPPAGAVRLQAHLIRPANDSTPSATISLHQLTESSRVPLGGKIDLKLEPGKVRTPILFDLPAQEPAATPGAAAPAAAAPASAAPLADLARGWVFEITPESQSPIEYTVRPTFWSAARFLQEPRPVIRDDRFTLELERLPAAASDVLLPAKIPVELVLPPTLQRTLTDYTLGGPVGPGQKLTLSFALPKDWSDQVRDRDWVLSLDAAGLPHSYRWSIDPQSNIASVTGQPPQLGVRLILPPDDPKAPPRLEPIIRKGKEPLHLQFQVDATELDRSDESAGNWTLSYQVVRESESGVEATPLRHSWRLFSSLDRRVLLSGVKGGAWSLRTAAGDYEMIVPPEDIRGLSGRFQVQAELTRSSVPGEPLARATLRFAIDDDTVPEVTVKGLSTEPRSTDKDLPMRIEAVDLESGIQHLVYGFDLNGDKVLQEDEEALDRQTLVGLDNPRFSWPVVILKKKLPKLQKNEEMWRLIVQARNGVGSVATKSYSVMLFNPPPPPVPKAATTGTLVVKLKLNRGGKAAIQVTGPDTRFEETSAGTVTFSELKPGQYTIAAKVNYAVIGQKEAGEAKVDVKVSETTTVSVPLLGVKQ